MKPDKTSFKTPPRRAQGSLESDEENVISLPLHLPNLNILRSVARRVEQAEPNVIIYLIEVATYPLYNSETLWNY